MDISFDLSNILGLSSTLVTLLGILLVIYKKRSGFLICTLGNVGWLYSELQGETSDFWFLMTCAIFIVVNGWGWFRWGNDACGKCTNTSEVIGTLIEDVEAVKSKLKGLQDE